MPIPSTMLPNFLRLSLKPECAEISMKRAGSSSPSPEPPALPGATPPETLHEDHARKKAASSSPSPEPPALPGATPPETLHEDHARQGAASSSASPGPPAMPGAIPSETLDADEARRLVDQQKFRDAQMLQKEPRFGITKLEYERHAHHTTPINMLIHFDVLKEYDGAVQIDLMWTAEFGSGSDDRVVVLDSAIIESVPPQGYMAVIAADSDTGVPDINQLNEKDQKDLGIRGDTSRDVTELQPIVTDLTLQCKYLRGGGQDANEKGEMFLNIGLILTFEMEMGKDDDGKEKKVMMRSIIAQREARITKWPVDWSSTEPESSAATM